MWNWSRGDASYFAPSHDCDQNASCLDSIGGFTCTCNTNYIETEKLYGNRQSR